MKKVKTILLPLTLGLCCGGMALAGIKGMVSASATDNGVFDRTYTKLSSDTLYVKKVENLPNDFIMGMDASSVIAEENSGVKYYDYNGVETDVFKVLSDSGINYIRVRVWNDPYDEEGNCYGGGNNDIATAIEIGKRATKYNMSLLVDFHYSDFWADPAKQMMPKAWEPLDDAEIPQACYEYTKDCLTQLKDAGVKVGMVQLGNETNGIKLAGFSVVSKVCNIMNGGARAVREVNPDALVAVHFANPEKHNYMDWATKLANNNVDYDVFGSSYYPYWHGTLDNLASELSNIATTFDKKTMVLETSYAYTTEDSDGWSNTIGTGGFDYKPFPFTIAGQANSVREITDTIANKTTNGIGICYWEGAWITVGDSHAANYSYEANQAKWKEYGSGWASEAAAKYDPDDVGTWWGGCAVDNQALFAPNGRPLESLKVFNLMRFGNEVTPYIDGVEDVTLIKNDNENFTLPETVNIIYSDNSKVATPVTWEPFDIEEAKSKGNAKYTIKGTSAGQEVYCYLQIMEYNYVNNYGFEEKEKGWTVKPLGEKLSDTNIAKCTSENPQTGTYAFHFWASKANTCKFEVEQEIKGLETANYKFQISLMGGGPGSNSANTSVQNNYAYVKVNGKMYQTSGKFTVWKAWSDILVKDIPIKKGDKVIVGFHIESPEAGVWGDIDDCMLNKCGVYTGTGGSSKGCAGSIETTAGLVTLAASFGLIFVLIRRRKLAK